jgi:copper chaperone NosL
VNELVASSDLALEQTTDGPGDDARAATPALTARNLSPQARSALMVAAALLTGAAIFLPLWGMTLASIQYPEGLRMVVYPTRIVGDVREINMLNGYIGMAKISREFFLELRMLPYLLGSVALVTVAVAFVRHPLLRSVPLLGLAGIAVYGFRSMATRMYEYGHRLDPLAPIDIEPFTPPMFGENQIAQFGTYAYFSWGTFLPLLAGLLIAVVIWADVREARGGGEEAP